MRLILALALGALVLLACGGPDGSDARRIVLQDPHDAGVFSRPSTGVNAAPPSGAQQFLHLLLPGVFGSSPDPLPGLHLPDGHPDSSPDPLPGRTPCHGPGCGGPDGN